MTRAYGRVHRSQRATCSTPRNWGRNQTLICAVQCAGPIAPLVIEGAVNGTIFEWDVKHQLCPRLCVGDVVVLDNLSAHHRQAVRTLIEERGATRLFLPPYSPDFNPIEMLFSKIKALVRAGNWRTLEALHQAIGHALDAISLKDIYGWIKQTFPNAL